MPSECHILLQVTVEGGVESVQGMKKRVREALGGEGVAYVDTRVGAPDAWIRFYPSPKKPGTKLTFFKPFQVHGHGAG